MEKTENFKIVIQWYGKLTIIYVDPSFFLVVVHLLAMVDLKQKSILNHLGSIEYFTVEQALGTDDFYKHSTQNTVNICNATSIHVYFDDTL